MKNDSLFWKSAVIACLVLNAAGWYIAASRPRIAPSSPATDTAPTNTLTAAAAEAAAAAVIPNAFAPAPPAVQVPPPVPVPPRNAAVQEPPHRTLALTDITPHSPSDEKAYCSLVFDHPVSKEQLEAFLDIEPACDFTLEVSSWYSWSERCYSRVTGDFAPGKTYQFTIRKGIAPEQRNVDLNEDIVRSVTFPDRDPWMGFADEGSYLPPNSDSAILSLSYVNLAEATVSARRLRDDNIFPYLRERIRQRWWADEEDWTEGLLGTEYSQPLELVGEHNVITNAPVDLRAFLPPGAAAHGTYLVRAKTENPYLRVFRLVVLSDIGLTVRYHDGHAVAWATSITTGKPLPGARVRLFSRTNDSLAAADTAADGTAELRYKLDKGDELLFATASLGDDTTFLTIRGNDVAPASAPPKLARVPAADARYEAFLFAGRNIVRPGEKLPVKLVVRDMKGQCPDPFPVALDLIRPDLRTAVTRTVHLAGAGTAEAEFDFAPEWPTGQYEIRAHLPGADDSIGTMGLSVEEIVPPQIKVSLTGLPEGVLPRQPRLAFTLVSEYLFGAPAADLPYKVDCSVRAVPFRPEGWDGYQFGDAARSKSYTSRTAIGQGRLTESGTRDFDFTVEKAPNVFAALELTLGAEVQHPGGRSVSTFATFPIAPTPYYIGLRPQFDGAVHIQTPTEVAVALVAPDGKPMKDIPETLSVSMETISRTWNWVRDSDNTWHWKVDVHVSQRKQLPNLEIDVNASTATLPLSFQAAGEYRIRIYDPLSDASSTLDVNAISPTDPWSHSGTENPVAISLSPSRQFYAPGDTVELTAKAPFAGEGLLFLESSSGEWTHIPVAIGDTAAVLSFPVVADDVPSIRATLVLLRPVVPQDIAAAKRVTAAHRAIGTALISIRKPERALAVDLDAPGEILPQSRLRVAAKVLAGDVPVEGAEVTFAAVDEGVHMLTGFQPPDPLAWANAPRWLVCEHSDPFSQMLPVYGAAVAEASHIGGDEAVLKRLSLVPNNRRFRLVALWKGTAPTGPDGTAETEFDVPEFTGSLRVMAVAIAPEAYGSANTATAVRRPVNVIPSLPRFAAPGDAFDATVALFNTTQEKRTATLRITPPTGAEPREFTADLDPGSSVVLTNRLTAPALIGEAHYVFRTSFDGDALPAQEETVTMPIRPAAAYSHQVKDGVLKPGETAEFPDFGTDALLSPTVRLCVSRRPEARFGSSLDYLVHYPYGCLEQTTSGVFPLLYLEDVLGADRPDLFANGRCRAFVDAGIDRLIGMQRHGGGFAYWMDESAPSAWGSIYATHFLLEAKEAGYTVPDKVIREAVDFVAGLLVQSNLPDLYDCGNNELELRAYAALVAVLARRTTLARPWLDRLLERHKQLSSSIRAHTAAALIACGRPRDAATILESDGIVPKEDDTWEFGGTLSSPVRDMALVLAAQCELAPDAPLASSLATSLISAKTHFNRWRTTQENAMAVLALGKYYRAVFSAPPDAVFAAEILRPGLDAPETSDLAKDVVWQGNEAGIRVRNAGDAPVFYSVVASGVPSTPPADPVSANLSVQRTFLDAQTGEPLAMPENGAPYVFAKGDLVAVRITLAPKMDGLDQIVVSDLLPAGLEIENPALATSAQVPQWLAEKNVSWIRSSDIRDDRLLLFTGELGNTAPRTYHYLSRAVSPGEYILPAIEAEAMYDPMVRARDIPMKLEVRP